MNNQFTMTGLMGWPVSHSRSPAIHNHWIEQHDLHGAYGLFPVEPTQLRTAINGLRALKLAGCNVTIPHKVEAMKHMDWVDPLAIRMGAINTIVVQCDGALHGFNTDGFGFMASLKAQCSKWNPSSAPIVVLGAGGAARAIIVSLIDAGATEIRLLNRTRNKADELCNEFPAFIKVYDWTERNDTLNGCALLVNTTSLGMSGQADLDIDLNQIPINALVCDVVYNPLETALLAAARQRGNTTVNGLGMLLHQARPAFNKWFGVMPEVTPSLIEIASRNLQSRYTR